MKNKNVINMFLIVLNLVFLFSSMAVASDEQPGTDAQVIFHVA